MGSGRNSVHRTTLSILVGFSVVATLVAACSSGTGASTSSTATTSPPAGTTSAAPPATSSSAAAPAAGSSSTAPAAGSSAAATGGAALTTVTFETDYLANGKYVPFIYGQSLGYFQQAGINLKIVYGHGSGLTAQAVAGGTVDVGMVDSGVVALAVGKGEPIKSVGLYLAKNDFAFFVPSTSSVTTIAGLAGKKLIVAPGTPQAIVAPAVFKLAGLSADAVKFVSVSASLADSSYAHGDGDAIGEAVTFAPIFQKTRPSRALPWISVGYRMPGFSFVVSNSTLSAHPDVVSRFLQATYKSMVASLDNPSAAVDAYAASQPTLAKDLIGPEWTSLTPFFCSDAAISAKAPLGFQEESDWAEGIGILQQAAGLQKSVTPDAVFTNDLFTKDNVSTQTCTEKWGGPFTASSGS